MDIPVADWLDPVALDVDPYPSYQRLREESPVAWVPALGQYLVTSYRSCRAIEEDPETFSAAVTAGASAKMARALGGRPMVNKDDPEHAGERRAISPSLRPKALRDRWRPVFAHNARTYVAILRERGRTRADLHHDFAAPLAAQNLVDLLGFMGAGADDMRRWSDAFVGGVGDLGDDLGAQRRSEAARQEVSAVLHELVPYYRRNPNESITSALVDAGLSAEQISANVNLTITGGMGGSQHVVTSAIWALSRNKAQRDLVLFDPSLWPAVFDETLRWVSPIGMYPRRATRDVTLEGVTIRAGAVVGVVVAAANRDPAEFDQAQDFDVRRPSRPHLAFGTGIHMCAGHWAARIAVGEVAVPMLYDEFRGLRPDPYRPEAWFGWYFRGLTSLPVT